MTVKSVSSLKSLLTTNKLVEVDFPGLVGFKLNLSFLSREDLVKIRKKATTSKFARGQMVETVDDKLFLQLYTAGSVKGWSGLKLAYVDKLAPVDLTGQDPEDTLEFSEENALYLMEQSTVFDKFISDTVTEIANFPSVSGK